jgi:hypothetical protein
MTTTTLIRAGLAGTLITTLLGFSLFAAQPTPRRTAAQLFMRQKLAWSQAALEGLTLEKFDLVAKNAIRMRDMTHSNQWFTIRQPDYLTQTTNYQKSVDALFMAATDKNLEAATVAYTQVMKNCIECHRMVRLEQHKTAGQAPAAKP